MGIVNFRVEGMICVTPCPFGHNEKVFSYGCKNCPFYDRQLTRSSIICNCNVDVNKLPQQNVERPTDKKLELKWRKCKAGYKFPSDAIVIPDDERTTDRDPRLVRCAVWDSKYILVDELKKLPVDNG
jgi:hypothetical protein